ncbi:hypothetical protein [Streptosporangium carneum]|uniref:Uncharacterized protein n=1 Tax=Streptosporangium carneum TaxID=47481 RepID=A0A9W6I5S3_9ACTN|nr:hypothetical protein [Streptosporangium carneum]GLK12541.1 hypothetical protein GCM10017600_59510 [Streptosporangium carneum]
MRTHRIRHAVATVAMVGLATLATSALPAAAAAASNTSEWLKNCSYVWSAWDPDEGAAAGYSYCKTPYQVYQHRVVLGCYYGGWAYGPWVRAWETSDTTCVDGSGASSGAVEVR